MDKLFEGAVQAQRKQFTDLHIPRSTTSYVTKGASVSAGKAIRLLQQTPYGTGTSKAALNTGWKTPSEAIRYNKLYRQPWSTE